MGRTFQSTSHINPDGGGGTDPDTVVGTIATPTLEYKYRWEDEWIPMPEAEMLSVEHASAHGGDDRCVFRRRYGDVKLPFETDFPATARAPFDGMQAWVRATLLFETETGIVPHKLFVGRVLADLRDVFNTGRTAANRDAAGVQTFTAYGPLALLDRIALSRSFWTDGTTETEIGWLPPMNLRNQQRTVIGNRSADVGDDDVYLYGGTETWSRREYVDYLLEKLAKQGDLPNSPQWRLGGRYDALDVDDDVSFGDATTVLGALRDLIDPQVGLDFRVYAYGDDDDQEDGFEIEVFPLSADEWSFGGETLPANANLLHIENPHDPVLVSIQLAQSAEHSYDQIRVVGGRVVVCCSIEGSALRKLWSDELEAAYIAGTGTAGDSGEKHDRARRATKYRDVFQRFGVDFDAWDFQGGNAAPLFDLDGELVLDERSDAQGGVRSTLSWLPLEEGVDYSGAPPFMSRNPDDHDPRLLSPSAFIYNEFATGYYDHAETFDVSARSLPSDLGLVLSCEPNHRLAAYQLGGFGSFASEHHYPYFAWENMVLTLAFESDQRIALGFDVPANEVVGDGARIEIAAPGAELWYLTPGTALEVDPATGDLVRSGEPAVVRDDLSRMRQIMAGAIARYYIYRNRAVLRTVALASWAGTVGQVLDVVDEGGYTNTIRGAITSVRWQMGESETGSTVATAGFVR